MNEDINKKNIIVFDTDNEPYFSNAIFQEKVASTYPGAMAIYYLGVEARKLGYITVTADMAINKNMEFRKMKVISEQTSRWTNILKKNGAELTTLICYETPSFAWKFYKDLPKIAKDYKNSFLFSGAIKKCNKKDSNFIPTLFPQPKLNVNLKDLPKWKERKFATMIHGNQTRLIFKPNHYLASLKDPDLRGELYSERRKAIEYFHKHEQFDLYGGGWEKWKIGVPYRQYMAARKCYKGRSKDKIETLSNYKFSICFENTKFEGYITEKIFDCFLAGCIPIYLGAPDIEDYIPTNCFIDFRKFNGYKDLEEYLGKIDEYQFNKYQIAIQNYLESRNYESLSYEYFGRKLLESIK